MANANLAKIHIAKKQIGLDDVAYRALLHRITEKTSAGKMNHREQLQVLAEFKRLGWKARPTGFVKSMDEALKKRGGKARFRKASTNPHIRKVWALGKELDNQGYWKLPWKKAVALFVKKETGIDDPDWLDTKQASQVIEALKAILARL